MNNTINDGNNNCGQFYNPNLYTVQGTQGDQGLVGPPGRPGKNGRDGFNGKDGRDGKKGLNGRDGLDGLDGLDGKNGKPGIQGDPGLIGDKGIKGEKGDTGPKGPTGYIGNTGLKGIVGDKGNTGIQGGIGYQGFDGQIGEQGDMGIIGDTGSQYLVGPTGNIGPQGITGGTGLKGPDGKQGITGNTGMVGEVGLNGTKGPTGYPGTTGPEGYIGNIGLKGPTGRAGNTGLNGKQGSTYNTYNFSFSYFNIDSTNYIGPQNSITMSGGPGFSFFKNNKWWCNPSNTLSLDAGEIKKSNVDDNKWPYMVGGDRNIPCILIPYNKILFDTRLEFSARIYDNNKNILNFLGDDQIEFTIHSFSTINGYNPLGYISSGLATVVGGPINKWNSIININPLYAGLDVIHSNNLKGNAIALSLNFLNKDDNSIFQTENIDSIEVYVSLKAKVIDG